jgi:hypothetical protein
MQGAAIFMPLHPLASKLLLHCQHGALKWFVLTLRYQTIHIEIWP